jgi:hypothetical protein
MIRVDLTAMLAVCATLVVLAIPPMAQGQEVGGVNQSQFQADTAAFNMEAAADQVETASEKLEGFQLALQAANEKLEAAEEALRDADEAHKGDAANKKQAARREVLKLQGQVTRWSAQLETAYQKAAKLHAAYLKNKSKVAPPERKRLTRSWSSLQRLYKKAKTTPLKKTK